MILQGEDSKAYTKYARLILVSADGEVLSRENLPVPGGAKGRFLIVQHLLDLPTGGFCLLMEQNAYRSGHRYANPFTPQLVQEMRSFQSGNILFTVLDAEGKIQKSGTIEKEQAQPGYLGNNYSFLSHSATVASDRVLVFYNQKSGEPDLQMAGIDFSGNLSAPQKVSSFSPKQSFYMFSNMIWSDKNFVYLVAYGTLVGYPNVHQIRLQDSSTSQR